MKYYFTVLCVMIFLGLNAQDKVVDEVRDFYLELNDGDSLALKKYFHKDAYVMHVGQDTSFSFSIDDFLDVCPKFKSGLFEQRINSIIALEVSPQVVTAQVEYRFFIRGEYLHCGVDHFTWVKKNDQMRILNILSTDNVVCEDDLSEENFNKSKLEDELNALLNKWHTDVADLELEAYFGLMTDDFIFLGTDPRERWTKEQFLSFCRPYFEVKKSTWNFKPIKRYWNFSEDGKIAWFDESINTQMEECRGSGVFVFEEGKWKIAHYNLTVLIENEKMKKFLKLRKK